MKLSPEITGAWQCACGNCTDFVGTDAHGYGGPKMCPGYDDGGYESSGNICPTSGDAETCYCETELTQPFSVIYGEGGTYEQGDIDYERYEGGGDDSEIGDYTRINCAACGGLIWEDENAKPI